jgi:enoyl-CoA hydratase
VLTDIRNGVLVVTLNRPARRNAIDGPTAHAIASSLERLDADDTLAAGVLTGAGGTFCAGGDLEALARGDRAYVEGRGFAGLIERPPRKPLIAAVEGYAVAGGMEVMLACDLVVAADDARFGLPEVKRGLVASGGGLIRCLQRLGRTATLELALTGDLIDADRALALGLVNRLTLPGEALQTALGLAETIAANAPLALAATKQIGDAVAHLPEAEAFAYVAPIAARLRASEDAREGARAFKERREPRWSGR